MIRWRLRPTWPSTGSICTAATRIVARGPVSHSLPVETPSLRLVRDRHRNPEDEAPAACFCHDADLTAAGLTHDHPGRPRLEGRGGMAGGQDRNERLEDSSFEGIPMIPRPTTPLTPATRATSFAA